MSGFALLKAIIVQQLHILKLVLKDFNYFRAYTCLQTDVSMRDSSDA